MPGPCPCSLPQPQQHSSAGSGLGKYFAPLSPQTLEHGCLLQAPPPPAPCQEGRSFALLLPTPRLAFGQRLQCPTAGLLGGRTWAEKIYKVFLFLPGMKAAPVEGQHQAAFLYFSAPLQEAQRRGFQAAVLVAVCSQGQERSFGHKPSLKKKKKIVSKAIFTYWKISI